MSTLNKISISLVGTAASVLIQLVGTMVIARLLTPNELGVFAVSAAASTLLAAFKNFGTSNYLIQCKAVDPPAVGSAFVATFAMSSILGTSLFLCSSPFARFFNEPDMALVMKVLAANFAITPFLTVGTALLIRFQNFKQLVLLELIAGIGGIVVSITTAYSGFGAMALALGTSTHSALTLVLITIVKPIALTYRPSLRDIRHVLRFGGWSSGAILLNHLGARSNEFIIGKMLGVGSAAMFEKGASLARIIGVQLFGDVLRVLLPVFAEQQRSNTDGKARYIEYVAILGTILTPLYVFLAFNSYSFISILYGSQWLAAVPVATVIALEYLLISPCLVGEKLLIANGRVKALFKVKLVQLIFRVLALLLFVRFGLVAASIGLLIAAMIYLLVFQLMLRRILVMSQLDFIKCFREPLVAGIGAVIVGVVMHWRLGGSHGASPFVQLSHAAAVNLITWLGLARLLRFSVLDILITRLRPILKAVFRSA